MGDISPVRHYLMLHWINTANRIRKTGGRRGRWWLRWTTISRG